MIVGPISRVARRSFSYLPRLLGLPSLLGPAGLLAGSLGACQVETGAVGVANDHLGAFRASNVEAVVGPNGDCPGGVNIDPSALRDSPRSVRQGISECDLVRLQGRPLGVTVVDLPDGTRRVEMFYPGNGGGTRGYTFVANRLVSTPPGTLKE